MTDTTTMHYLKPGLGNASSYQVSGKPFLTGSVAVPNNTGTPVEIKFPQVTKKLIITNTGTEHLRVGFSDAGIKGSNFTLIHEHNPGTGHLFNTLELEVKCTSVFLLSNDATNPTSFCLAAELTNIPASELLTNWSGSAGIG